MKKIQKNEKILKSELWKVKSFTSIVLLNFGYTNLHPLRSECWYKQKVIQHCITIITGSA